MFKSVQKSHIIYLSFVIFGFALYVNVLSGEFVSDDYVYIVGNHTLHNLFNITGIWTFFNTRFLTGWTFALNYALGGHNVFGYHLVNVVLHIINTILVYILINLTFDTPALKDSKLKTYLPTISVFAGLIFLCHPVQTQAVAFISQRLVLLASMFYLLSLIFYIRARLEKQRKWIVWGVLTTLLGMISKEMTITIPIALVIYEFYFFKGSKKINIKRFKWILPFCVIFILLPLMLFSDNHSELGIKKQISESSHSARYIFTEINVLRTYLRMFIMPTGLAHDYDYPLANSFFEGRTLTSFCILLALIALAGWLYKRHRLLSFCIVWFFLATSVEALNVVLVSRMVIFDHWLYLPMVGFAIFFTVLMHIIAKDKAGYRGLLTAAIIVLSIMTVQRNKVWQTEIGFWKDNLLKAPNKAEVHFGAAKAYHRRANKQMAGNHYAMAIKFKRDFVEAYSNFGILSYEQGNKDVAIKTLRKAITLNPKMGEVYNNLAHIYFLEGDCPQALSFYKQSLERQDPYPEAYYYTGLCYQQEGKRDLAIRSLMEARKIHVAWGQQEDVFMVEKKIQEIKSGK